jgi:sugar/nucleoside kinase (ribokinase family)
MKYDVIAIGGAVEDQFIHTAEGVLISNPEDKLRQNLLGFEYGAKVLVDNSETAFGGGAANAAVAFSRLGLKTAILSCVGVDQRGLDIFKNFKQNKVATKLIQTTKKEPTGFSVVVVAKSGEHVVFPVRGANNELKVTWSAGRNLGKSRWLYLTSLSGDWQKTLHSIFSNKGRAQIAWNPGHVQLMAGIKFLKPYLEHTTVLILNVDEALELLSGLTQYKTKKKALPEKIDDIVKAVHSLGPKLVLVTNGAEGALAFDGEKKYRFKPKKIKQVMNTIGVGDAFGSSFVAGLQLFGDVDKALELAGLNSARVVAAHGAQENLIFKKQLYG